MSVKYVEILKYLLKFSGRLRLMREIVFGVLAFFLFIASDINSIKWKHSAVRYLFFAGCLLLAYSTSLIFFQTPSAEHIWRLIIFGGAAACFFALLMYALFFAIPFGKTYIAPSGKPIVCRTGMYSMCRHPGVLWLAGMYLFLYLVTPAAIPAAAAVIFSTLNVIYVLWQDIYVFPILFEDYDDYKKSVPFLIPFTKCNGGEG